MKNACVLAAVVAMSVSTFAFAAEIKSGLQEGDLIGAFHVTKVAGAENDGVKEGKSLCYRCRNGRRPQVMVFTRSTDEKVLELVRQLDKAIEKNQQAQLRAFVNLLGQDKSKLNHEAKKVAKKSKANHVPFVVPNEFENGPGNYGLNEKAEVTVLLATGGKVKANHAATRASELDPEAIVADLKKILN